MRNYNYRVIFTTEINGIRIMTSHVVRGISEGDARATFLRGAGLNYDHVIVANVTRLEED